MSAYMVNPATVDAIARVVVEKYWRPEQQIRDPVHRAQWQQAVDLNPGAALLQDHVGRVLVLANAAGMRDRYGDDCQDEVRAYSYSPRVEVEPAVLLKACACFEYQACEWSAWEQSLALVLVRYAHEAAVSALPGYQDAPWGLNDDNCPKG